ncbi:MAG: PIN domain-containing protein, partial [Neobacillus sp.]
MLEIVEKNNGLIFISDLVLKETRKNYIRNLEINLKKLKNQYKQLNKFLLNPLTNELYSTERYIDEFDQFYTEFTDNHYVEVLEYNNQFLPEVIRRSIGSIKPFAENRKEFMDCLIWLTYSSLVEKEELEDCYLISNNITDYYDETNANLHPDLLNDTKRIKPYRFPSDLIRYEPLLAKNDEMLSWAENEKIDESYLTSLFQSNLFELTNSFFQEFFSKLMPVDIYKYSIGKTIEPGKE